jgi:hypothetical protein
MINPSRDILKAWFELLVETDPINYPVYRYENPNSESEYIILRMESDRWVPNDRKLIFDSVLVVESIVRVAANAAINDLAAWAMDTEVGQKVFDSAMQHNLPQQNDIRFTDVNMTSRTYQLDADDTYKYFRVISRYTHKISIKP